MNIFNDGVLIEIHVRYCKSYQFQEVLLNEINQSLIPTSIRKKLKSLESRARFLLDNNSFKFPIGTARFVPNTKLKKLIKKLKEYKDAYDEIAHSLITNYISARKELIKHEEIKNYPESIEGKFSLKWDIYKIFTENENIIIDFLKEVISTLREETVTIFKKINAMILSGNISGRTISSLKKFIINFNELNFIGDPLEESLNSIEKTILKKYNSKKISEDRDIQEKLKEKINITLKKAQKDDIESIIKKYSKKET